MAATVGMTHLRSFFLSAGRKNAMTSQMMMGEHTMAPKKTATLKRIVKPPSTVRTVSLAPCGSAARMGFMMNSMRTGVAL